MKIPFLSDSHDVVDFILESPLQTDPQLIDCWKRQNPIKNRNLVKRGSVVI